MVIRWNNWSVWRSHPPFPFHAGFSTPFGNLIVRDFMLFSERNGTPHNLRVGKLFVKWVWLREATNDF